MKKLWTIPGNNEYPETMFFYSFRAFASNKQLTTTNYILTPFRMTCRRFKTVSAITILAYLPASKEPISSWTPMLTAGLMVAARRWNDNPSSHYPWYIHRIPGGPWVPHSHGTGWSCDTPVFCKTDNLPPYGWWPPPCPRHPDSSSRNRAEPRCRWRILFFHYRNSRIAKRVPPVYSFLLFQNFFVLFYYNFIIGKELFV